VEERTLTGPNVYEKAGDLLVATGNIRTGTDSVGSVSTQTGLTASRFDIDPWGNYFVVAGRFGTPPPSQPSAGYAGTSFEASLGLHYAQQRWLDPVTGTWLQEDPVFGRQSDPSSLNPWLYAQGNPTRFADPDGRCINLFTNDLVSWRNCKESLQVLGGYWVGAAKVVGSVGILTYNLGGNALYALTGDSIYREQALAVRQMDEGLAHLQADPAGAIKSAVLAAGRGLADAVNNGDAFAAGESFGTISTQALLLAEAAPKPTIAPSALAPAVATSGAAALRLPGMAVAATGPGIPELAMAASVSQANETAGKKRTSRQNPEPGQRKAPESEARKAPREVETVRTHPSTGGNRQVTVNGQRWNLPKDLEPSKIPEVDPIGDQLQVAAKDAAEKWDVSKLTRNEQAAIETANAQGKHWLARLLERQARGRWVESEVRSQFPNLQWSARGVDVQDPLTGMHYDILSGTESNMAAHAMRMPDLLFRMITF